MKQFYLHTTPSGIELIEGDKMPVKPVDICGPSEAASCYDRLCHEGRSKTYCFKRYHYEQEIERAKASGIPVKDQERAVSLIAHGQTILDIEKAKAHYCKPGEVYGPFNLSYEIVYNQKNQELVGMFMQLPTHEKIGICKNMGYNSTYYQEGKTLQDSDKDFFIWIAGNKRTNELKAIVPTLFEEWHLRAYQKPYKSTSRVAILLPDKGNNLLPCPFCGSQPEWINEALADSHFYIKCPNCHIVMKEDRRDKVIGMWNNRLPAKEEQGLREQIAQILRDNITFSGQVGYYVIHGAIDKLIELFTTRKQ